MVDAQHACSPPPGLEYAIPLPPSPAARPARCGSPFDLSESACAHQVADLSPAPAMRVPIDGVDLNPGDPPCAGESGSSDRPEVSQEEIRPALPLEPKVSFEEFAIQYRRRQHAEAQRRSLEHRLVATKVSICLSARLLRVAAAVQKGLVEAFKHGDKPGFVTIYSAIHDLQEACDSAFRRTLHRQDPLEEPSLSLHSERTRSSGFMHQLSPKARSGLLEILNLVRTDPRFLFDRISSLTPSQLAALTSSVISDTGDSVLSFTASRSRNQPLFSKRNSAHSVPFKDYALAFERTDPLSVLLFNVFAVPLDWDPAEAHLRLDVWSSTCAKLISHGDSRYHPFVGHVLSYWSLCSDWKAKPKLELYLMDVLQKGAFLLENIESPVASSFGVDPPDPLKTDAAEEFFDAAVQTLFEVLDDADAGLPSATLEFGNAILTKIAAPESQDRFLEYIFIQWFFSRFLYNTLTFPETQGLLLDFHIGKDAREKILGQIALRALRAQSQIFRVLHSAPQFSTAHPKVRKHVESMLAKFTLLGPPEVLDADLDLSRQFDSNPSSRFVMLSAMDIITLLNALFPRPNFNASDSVLNPGSSPLTLNTPFSSARSSRVFDPPHWPGSIDTILLEQSPRLSASNSVLSQSAMYSRNADVIRFELSDIGESEDRPSLDHPSTEDWAVLAISEDGKSLVWNLSNGALSGGIADDLSDDGLRSATIHPEEDYEALQTAIVKLVNESEPVKQSVYGRPTRSLQTPSPSLKQRFDHARSACEQRSDFLGAHYWWTATQQLSQSLSKLAKKPQDDSWILDPMFNSSNSSLSQCDSVIRQCESSFVTLNPVVEQLQETVQGTMSVLTRLRNKMWYMTDVKNSMRYEDAKNVALALKTMVYPSLQRQPSNEYRGRNGSRYLASSFLQKPEMQVMNVMKAPSSQGGPNKLSDEQVELTRKWLTHHGIDNFCRGEERIHRFCYEVKSSVNKLVGDTMAETPVLWASELFQKERAKYEAPSNKGFPGISPVAGIRPSSIASEDSLYTPSPFPGFTFRGSETFLRPQAEVPSLMRKSSFQSLSSDKWKAPRGFEAGDSISSLGDSPGRAASSTTADTYSTFWSPPQTQAHSAASASSFRSRPPSMFSEAPAPRRAERDVHGKTAFLDDLRQTLTSLLLSDLGCPVWSCGSETDAWFTNFLNQKRVQVQMDKRAKIQKFLAECESRPTRRAGRPASGRWHLRNRRSQSADPVLYSPRKADQSSTQSESAGTSEKKPPRPTFPYETAFRQLMEIFSRHANPFIKLKALRDLRALVIASLNASNEYPSTPDRKVTAQALSAVEMERNKRTRHSFSEPFLDDESLQTPTSPVPESVEFGSRPSYDLSAAESQVIKTMKDLIRKIQPKTLFRDLQFISAFVPSETLNKTESGTAFLHFGLAALALKDEVCDSMVEIADRIVSQELSRRHSPAQAHETNPRPRNAIEDAAGMWIITAKEGNPVAQRELAILYLTHPEILPRVTLPLTLPRDTYKAEMMYRRDKDSKSDPQSMCLALHWMQLSANGGDELARNRLREREEFESLA